MARFRLAPVPRNPAIPARLCAGMAACSLAAGAPVIVQLEPDANEPVAITSVGSTLSFSFHLSGASYVPAVWKVTGNLPPGLSDNGSTSSAVDSIVGTPLSAGVFPITVTACQFADSSGASCSGLFNISVGAAIITASPPSTSITSGKRATLTVTATGNDLTYQWYQGVSPSTAAPIPGATARNFKTPVLTANASYWARVSHGDLTANSATAFVSVGDSFAAWQAGHFSAAQLADAGTCSPGEDPDGDGIRNSDEYVLGTQPLACDGPLLTLSAGSDPVGMRFVARQATGFGYAGKTRHYALETTNDLNAGAWTPVAGYEDVAGNGQTVNCPATRTGSCRFYRLRVWLTP